jgi:Icc-related predicted phosphoesterase
MQNNTYEKILVLGDHHGNYNRIFDKIYKNQIENCLLIHVGDGGEGFKSRDKEIKTFNILNEKFKSLGIQYMSIRGNHSDPSYFDGSVDLSNFKLLPDYHTEIINEEKFLFVGGAVSIDRIFRKEGSSYWSDEIFVLKPELVEKCDVLITHSAPSWIGPFDKESISSWCEKDKTLWDLCYKERIEHNELIKLCQPSKSYHGHFHASHWVDFDGCYSTILEIEEIKEHRKA